ncbi:amino acid adenylation domain-containing protein [Nocardiopsis dassonvillei]|uniref:amino acid adenylation domain-containing protein n=1 Tax=Nocardiopsis dassonvillei TaxID=2014 RepID=UPI0036FADB24
MTHVLRSTPTLPDMLTEGSRAHPLRTALTDGVRSLSYRDLDTAAERVAARLAARGLGRGDRVALLGPRDARLCALLHGVLRSGAAAVVVDPEWSAADVTARLDDVEVAHALTADPDTRAPGERDTEVLDPQTPAATAPAPRRVPGRACDPAYLSFTSGSSGRPKAVTVTHANAAHYALALRDRLGLTRADAPVFAHVTTLAADLGHTSWLLALATGGRVHVVPDRTARDPRALWDSLRRARVSVLKTTPSHMAALVEERPPAQEPLHTLLLGGEALPRSLASDLLEDGVAHRVVNHYGPTETTIGATCLVARSRADLPGDEPTVPIGAPIGGARLHLLDAEGREVPDGTEGELLIGGPGVTAGYFGRPEETARRFVGRGGERMYRTGDVCRRRPDGDLVFVGRTDREVKVRGYRVDPVGVERVIEGFPGVGRSAVLARETPAGTALVAAVRPTGAREEAELLDALRAHLRERLPGYAVPQPVVALDAFPTGPNGKLDRARLAEAVNAALDARARRTAPDGPAPDARPLVRAIAELWAGALGLPSVGPGADVLELGGDSLLAMRTVAFLRRSGLRVAFEDFYRHPTPELLASAARPGAGDPAERAPHPEHARTLAPAQRWLLRQPLADTRHWNQSVLLRCAAPVDAPALSAAVGAVLERHPALRTPVGPGGPGRPRPARDLHTVSFSRLPGEPGRATGVIGGTCTELHRGLDPDSGLLLRAHLFTGHPDGGDRLAVIAHHLAVDGLSWRILLDDLAHAYRSALSGKEECLPPTADFYRWAARTPRAPGAPGTAAPPRGGAAAERARPTALVWSLDGAATDRLVHRHGHGQDLEAFLLAAFADAVLGRGGRTRLEVEVETHGRDTSDAGHAYMDTVGWFTGVKRVGLDRADGGPAPRARAVRLLLREAPELPMDSPGPRPEAGFNFLGTFRPPGDPSLGWTAAPEQAGNARCSGGDPLQRLRLTARVVEGRLVADLVYAWPDLPHEDAAGVLSDFGRRVAAQARAKPPAHSRSPVSTSGQPMLHGAPHHGAAVRVLREPARVLLTGATGYLGTHLLGALLERGAEVTCLVRADSDADAVRRVGAGSGGVDAVAGDVTREGLGLSGDGLRRVRGVHAVVHAAADVRLVAPPDELERVNATAVRALVSWIDAEVPGARLHHLSTLAVCGGVEGPARRFSEADLRIGQSFRTPYERTKFAAEEIVRSWAASGRQCYVHRSGHIAAHSRTGAFQSNVSDNRVYQLVRGYVLAGAAPRRPSTSFVFSHVDTVAAGIAAIATHPCAAPGAYHVESPHQVPHDELVAWLARHGYPVALTGDEAFAAALARAEPDHPTEIRLASAWSQMEERNVVVDGSRTVSLLDRAGVRFAAPTPRWWSAALGWAARTGFLPPVAVHDGATAR